MRDSNLQDPECPCGDNHSCKPAITDFSTSRRACWLAPTTLNKFAGAVAPLTMLDISSNKFGHCVPGCMPSPVCDVDVEVNVDRPLLAVQYLGSWRSLCYHVQFSGGRCSAQSPRTSRCPCRAPGCQHTQVPQDSTVGRVQLDPSDLCLALPKYTRMPRIKNQPARAKHQQSNRTMT